MTYPINTAETRKQWVKDNLGRIDAEGWTYRDIAANMKAYFGMPKPVSLATVGRYLEWARTAPSSLSPEAQRLLLPEHWPELRDKLFGYQTSKTQHALYWVMRCLALKIDIPEWVRLHFELPENVNDDLIEKEKLLTFILMMAPRHGKTMTMVHGLITLYSEFPNLRVIYCQGVATTTQDINALIMLEMEDNDKLMSMYGPFRDDDRQWSREKGFILAKRDKHSATPSFLPVGITSNVRSRDADILIIDDPQDIERAESETTTYRDYRKITAEFMTRREPHTPVLMVGSHLPVEFGDVFTQIEENLDDIRTEGQDIYINKRKAHDDEGCLVWDPDHPEVTEHYDCLEWPEYRSWNFLMAQKALLGEEMYEAVYQQDARLSGTKPFDKEVVKGEFGREGGGIRDYGRSWKQPLDRCPQCSGDLYMCVGFDPARGKSKGASYTAVAVVQGCIKCLTYYLIDYLMERMSSDYHADTAISYMKSFQPHMLRIEINAYQEALARNKDLLEFASRNSIYVDEWETDDRKNTAELGIPMMAKSFRTNHFSMPYQTDQDQLYAREAEKAFIRYPKKPNDVPMAVWLAVGGCLKLFELYADLDPIYLRGRQENVPSYLVDEPLRVNLAMIGADRE